jgi:hypothetical protein
MAWKNSRRETNGKRQEGMLCEGKEEVSTGGLDMGAKSSLYQQNKNRVQTPECWGIRMVLNPSKRKCGELGSNQQSSYLAFDIDLAECCCFCVFKQVASFP